ncbi:SDR family NAD(P)-dependent oxidoreductase [bacterium]|nr:SDR family NAD(P)-dependent oxidoreductase [bacterium]
MSDNSKVILITGASSGIGKASAEYLAQQGHIVFGTSRYPGSFPKPNDYTILQMDVTDDNSIQTAINQIIENKGKLDVLINNAGFGIAGAIEHTSIDKAKEQFETNFFGTVRLIKSVLPIMRKQDFGLIINISSIGGLIGLPFQSMYSAAKFAVEGLSEALYKELRTSKIRVVLVEPGDFKTNFTERRDIDKISATSENFSKVIEVIENDENNGQDPILIAKLLVKIINKSNPRLRYVIGAFDQKLAAFLKRILPNRLFDWIIMKHYMVV